MKEILARLRARRAEWKARSGRSRADSWARLAAIIAAGIAVAALWPVWDRPLPQQGTSVEKSVETFRRETKGKKSHLVRSSTNESKRSEDSSLVDLLLGEGGLFILGRLGVIAAVAFLMGAVVQRVLLAKFAVKLGPLEIKEPEMAPTELIKALEEGVDLLRNEVTE